MKYVPVALSVLDTNIFSLLSISKSTVEVKLIKN